MHRWSGWPGAWCLDCGCGDPVEMALADGVDPDPNFHSELAARYPNHPGLIACTEPDSRRCDPYGRKSE
jgi:hypothetical protein